MKDCIEYREAQAEDEDALVGLWWSMQASHHTYDPVWYADKGEQWCKASWRAHFRRLLREENAVVIVATRSGTPVGMIMAQYAVRPPIYTTERIVEIDSTVVHPDFRRTGVFKGMLSLLEEKARSAGIKAIHLVVDHRNEDARHAYRNSGFAPETMGLVKWIE